MVAVVVSIFGAWGYIEYKGPDYIVSRASPEARQDSFTAKDYQAISHRIEQLEGKQEAIMQMMQTFVEIGPKLVRENQIKILAELAAMRRQQEEHFLHQAQSRSAPIHQPQLRPW